MTRDEMLAAYDQAAAVPGAKVLVVITPVTEALLSDADHGAARRAIQRITADAAGRSFDRLVEESTR